MKYQIDTEKLSEPAALTMENTIRLAKSAHWVDLIFRPKWLARIRINGEFRHLEADWIKYLEQGVCKPNLTNNMQWTTTSPTEPGWYWWRAIPNAEFWKPIEWKSEDIKLSSIATGEWWPERIKEPPHD